MKPSVNRLLIINQVFLVRLHAFVLLFNFTSCAKKLISQIYLMPSSDLYDAGAIDPFTDSKPLEAIPYEGMLNATESLRKKMVMKIFTLTKEGFSCGCELGKCSLGIIP